MATSAKKPPEATTKGEHPRGAVARMQRVALRTSAGWAGAITRAQRTLFERAMDRTQRVQKSSGDRVYRFVKDASFVPPEGAEIVKAWNQLILRGQKDLERSGVKSFSLLEHLYERIEEANGGGRKRVPRHRAAVRPKPASEQPEGRHLELA